MHRFVLYNDRIIEAGAATIAPGRVGFMTGWGVFSTIRVSRGVLFEFKRHYERMKRDAAAVRVTMPEADWLEGHLLRLVEANTADEATLRVNIIRTRGGLFEGPDIQSDFDVVAFTANLKKWGDSVRLALLPHGRHAANKFAGTKVTSWIFNLNLYEEAHERGFDEVVLLNERQEVSECTSANIFIVIGNDVWTPPLDSGCLAGITRDLLLCEIKVPGITIRERRLTVDDLQRADEVFITSTTRDLLPVVEIDGIRKGEGSAICSKLCASLRNYIEDYCCSRAIA
jgi:branched-chain amino acid aminotransferase